MQAIGKKAVDTSKKVRAGLIGASWTAEAHVTVPEIPGCGNRGHGRPDSLQAGKMLPAKRDKPRQRPYVSRSRLHAGP
jgi:hypothetical protein